MSITDKIQRLEVAKEEIANAIESKGGTVNQGDGFEEFSASIKNIPEGIQVNIASETIDNKFKCTSVSTSKYIFEIPEGAETLSASCFHLVFSSGITAYLISKLVMPDSVTSIEDGTTSGAGSYFAKGINASLEEVILSSNLIYIGDYAFYSCYKITSIVIPRSIQAIGVGAFSPPRYTSWTMQDVYYEGTQEEWGAISIGERNTALTAATIHYNYVPE